jgi:hypothetical protein
MLSLREWNSKPQLTFVEKGVAFDALFKHLDWDHKIEFDPKYPNSTLESIDFQMQEFRQQCENYRSKKSFDGFMDFAVKGLAVIGGVVILAKILEN